MTIEQEFFKLFEGLATSYGTYSLSNSTLREDLKRKGKATTFKGAVTTEMWRQHLKGEVGLGIIPINENNSCKFGAIDIDIYTGMDLDKLYLNIEKYNLPMMPCKTKSGGIHLYIFFSEWVPAELVQKKLKDIASVLGYGNSEIFPKQTQILTERGDMGSWINMPYFGETRQCKDMDAREFLNTIRQLSLEEFTMLNVLDSEYFKDGPPCLQTLAKQGFGEGTRNDSLYNIAVYLRKKFPDKWRDKVEEYNRTLMDPILNSEEVIAVCNSVNKKKYRYTCSKSPIQPYCNGTVCKSREYGISDMGESIVITSISVYNTKPPIWFANVEGGGRVELESKDLVSQTNFQKKCLENLNFMPTKMKDKTWTEFLNKILENAEIIEAPEDASYKGQLDNYISSFCTGQVQAKSFDEISQGKPFFDTRDNRHYFTINILLTFLERNNFKVMTIQQIALHLNSSPALKSDKRVMRIKNRQANVWSIENQYVEDTETLTTDEELKDEESPF